MDIILITLACAAGCLYALALFVAVIGAVVWVLDWATGL